MAIKKLDWDIRAKLKKAFCISNNELDEVLALLNKSLIPEVETHYLSYLISSVEKLMREKKERVMLLLIVFLSIHEE